MIHAWLCVVHDSHKTISTKQNQDTDWTTFTTKAIKTD